MMRLRIRPIKIPKVMMTSHGHIQNRPRKKVPDSTLSKQEAELQRDVLVLVFLYEFNRVRQIVREAWILFRAKALTLVSAALVTDLVQSYVQQNVAALVEDFEVYDMIPRRSLFEIVRQIYEKLYMDKFELMKRLNSDRLPNTALRHLFCIDAMDHLKAVFESPPPTNGCLPKDQSQFPFQASLRYFDAIRSSKVPLPIWDKSTECMIPEAKLRRQNNPNAFLPFGF